MDKGFLAYIYTYVSVLSQLTMMNYRAALSAESSFCTSYAAMFTGLVERIGTVIGISPQDTSESGGNGWSITVGDAASILGDCHIGDSIAINGL